MIIVTRVLMDLGLFFAKHLFAVVNLILLGAGIYLVLSPLRFVSIVGAVMASVSSLMLLAYLIYRIVQHYWDNFA